jgi:hypothetical protein
VRMGLNTRRKLWPYARRSAPAQHRLHLHSRVHHTHTSSNWHNRHYQDLGLGDGQARKSEKPVYQRYVTRDEFEKANENPQLIPGETTGKAFFTDEIYDSQFVAYDRLSLYEQKDYRMAFQFTENPEVIGPRPVDPRFTQSGAIITNGGGMEYYITNPAVIKILGVFPLGP